MASNIIHEFLEKEIKANAPLNIKNDQLLKDIENDFNIYNLNLKYPYKPFLLLSIVNNIDAEKVFNNWIELNNFKIIKSFYDYICNDCYLYEILKSHKGKSEWCMGLNDQNYLDNIVYKSVIQVFIDSPLRAFKKREWISVNKTSIKININSNQVYKDVELIKQGCWEIVYKCIPWYQYNNKADLKNVVDLVDSVEKTVKVKVRQFQHQFRKNVLDRDCKCIICCTDNRDVLQACHIKPFHECKLSEQYDIDNGLTLCSNHHLLFDNGRFTFDNDWKVIISKTQKTSDINLFFRQYESCYSNILKNKFDSNIYLKYHKENIYKAKKSL